MQPPQPGPRPGEDPFSVNPYAPTIEVGDVTATTDDIEAYRKKYLSHEASVQSIGLLYLLGALLFVPIGLLTIVGAAFAGDPVTIGSVLGVGVFYLAIGLLQGYAGLGLRKLQPGARNAAIVFSAIGLLGFPVGTLISAYFLYLLVSAKGKIVFSDEYKDVIRQTPHIKYKTSILVWIFLGLLILFIALGVIALIVAGTA